MVPKILGLCIKSQGMNPWDAQWDSEVCLLDKFIKAFGSSLSYAFVDVFISSCVSGLSSWHNPILLLSFRPQQNTSHPDFVFCAMFIHVILLHSLDLFWSTSIFLKVSKAHSSCQSFLPNFTANPSFCRAAPCNQPFMAMVSGRCYVQLRPREKETKKLRITSNMN